MFQFLRLSAKFLAVLRLSVNPIETLSLVAGRYKFPTEFNPHEPKFIAHKSNKGHWWDFAVLHFLQDNTSSRKT